MRAVVASHAVFSSAKVRIATIKEAACDCIREGGVISTENREKNLVNVDLVKNVPTRVSFAIPWHI